MRFLATLVLAGLVAGALCNRANTCNQGRYIADCGFTGITQQQCAAKGCCWAPSSASGVPWCFYPNGYFDGYKVVSSQTTESGMVLDLALSGGDWSAFGASVSQLRVNVSMADDATAHIKIFDPNATRWEVPQSFIPRSEDPGPVVASAGPAKVVVSNGLVKVSYTSQPFGIAVTRLSDGEVLFNSTPTAAGAFNGLTFKDQYLELSTQLPRGANLYGLGEATRPDGLRLNASSPYQHTLWAHDTPSALPYSNLYGAHPFYVELRPAVRAAHGVLLLNSNGMDVNLTDTEAGAYLTYRVIGGVLDFYVYAGPTPEEVVAQHTRTVGRPLHPPFWSLGFHNCRWGYDSLAEVEQVVANYSAAGIALEAAWMDIDYMDAVGEGVGCGSGGGGGQGGGRAKGLTLRRQYKDFTFDPAKFPVDQVQAFVAGLHAKGQRAVVILDPGILNQQGYAPFDEGVKQDVFLKSASGSLFIGKVRGGPAWVGGSLWVASLGGPAWLWRRGPRSGDGGGATAVVVTPPPGLARHHHVP